MLPKEEQIVRLKRGISSPETPDYIRERMKAQLEELERPEPAPQPKAEAKPKPVVKKPAKAKPEPKTEVIQTTPPPSGPSADDKARMLAEIKKHREREKAKKQND